MVHRAPVLPNLPVASDVPFRVTALRAREAVLALAEDRPPGEPIAPDTATGPQPPSRHRRPRASRRRPSADAGATR